jgi:hypothetical protein
MKFGRRLEAEQEEAYGPYYIRCVLLSPFASHRARQRACDCISPSLICCARENAARLTCTLAQVQLAQDAAQVGASDAGDDAR